MIPGELSRWWIIKMGRSPSSPEIYQKYICMWNNCCRTSERWLKTSDFQKGKLISKEWGRWTDIGKWGDKGFGTGICILGRELWRRKNFCTLGRPLMGRNCGGGGASEPQRGTGQQVPSQDTIYTCTIASRGWVQRLRLWGSDPKEKPGVECSEDTLRGLVQHSWWSLGESLGLLERQKIIATETI